MLTVGVTRASLKYNYSLLMLALFVLHCSLCPNKKNRNLVCRSICAQSTRNPLLLSIHTVLVAFIDSIYNRSARVYAISSLKNAVKDGK